jgi:hypothetical protein
VGQSIVVLCIFEAGRKPAPKDLKNASKITKNAPKLIEIRGFEWRGFWGLWCPDISSALGCDILNSAKR